MTFLLFCHVHKVSRQEAHELIRYLAFYRMEETVRKLSLQVRRLK